MIMPIVQSIWALSVSKKKKKNVASVRKQQSADVRFDERERGNDNQATRSLE